MSPYLGIPAPQIGVVPLGINMDGYSSGPGIRDSGSGIRAPFTVGYFARVAPEKGLHVLVDAYVRLRRRTSSSAMRLEVAGYLARANQDYLDAARATLDRAGLGAEFCYRGEVDRAGKLAFLRTLDVLSVPATYDEPKGMFVLEAMASGVPVVQPRRGAFVEMVERTAGGLLVEPDDPEALAEGLHALWSSPDRRSTMALRAAHGTKNHYTVSQSADRLIELYTSVLNGTRPAGLSVA
jgi:glycosyltransferase involved in cell wall biosynthesis